MINNVVTHLKSFSYCFYVFCFRVQNYAVLVITQKKERLVV